jgi:hypothetical protein
VCALITLTTGAVVLEVTLVSCNDLLPSDVNGFSDPYVKFKIIPGTVKEMQRVQSSHKSKTLNPIWVREFCPGTSRNIAKRAPVGAAREVPVCCGRQIEKTAHICVSSVDEHLPASIKDRAATITTTLRQTIPWETLFYLSRKSHPAGLVLLSA